MVFSTSFSSKYIWMKPCLIYPYFWQGIGKPLSVTDVWGLALNTLWTKACRFLYVIEKTYNLVSWSYLLTVLRLYVHRDCSVGIATRYVQDGPGIKSQWEARFFAPFNTSPGDHPDSYTMSTWSTRGKAAGTWRVDHSPHLAPRLTKE